MVGPSTTADKGPAVSERREPSGRSGQVGQRQRLLFCTAAVLSPQQQQWSTQEKKNVLLFPHAFFFFRVVFVFSVFQVGGPTSSPFGPLFLLMETGHHTYAATLLHVCTGFFRDFTPQSRAPRSSRLMSWFLQQT